MASKFSVALSARMAELEHDANDAANAIGVSPATIRRWITDRVKPRSGYTWIAKYMGVGYSEVRHILEGLS